MEAKEQRNAHPQPTSSISSSEKLLTISDFCSRNLISRAGLYNLWSNGKGPRRMKVGAKTLITPEAEKDWRRQCEQEPVSAKEPEAA